MRHSKPLIIAAALLALSGCSRDAQSPAADQAAANAPAAAQASTSTDAEYEQLKTVTPLDACATLTPEKLKAVFPALEFSVHQELKPQLSGYLWDSRCTYWAGVGTQEFAKDVPTHTVEIFIGTSANVEKAKRNLASRHETAVNATGYQAQAALGENAYSTTNTGFVSLFFVKGQSEIQINLSDLSTPNEQKIQNAIALAQSL